MLLRGIIEAWVSDSRTPVLLVPIPMFVFIEGSSDPTAYQTRFRELAADVDCRLYDPLPDLWKIAPDERRALWSGATGHLSKEGHAALARLLAPVIADFMREHRAMGAGV